MSLKKLDIDISKRKKIENVLIDFYSILLEDEHASGFITSINQIDNLLQKQSYIVLEAIEYIKNHQYENLKNRLNKIVERHFELGISPKAMFDYIKTFTHLLSDSNIEGIKGYQIAMFRKFFEEEIAKVYIENYIEDTIAFLSNERSFRLNTAYDEYVYTQIISHLKSIKSIFSNKDEKLINRSSIFSHINCELGRFLSGIGFYIISNDEPKTALTLKGIHKLIHIYIKDLVLYMQEGKYEKAVYTTLNLIGKVYEFLQIYFDLSLKWKNNKDKIISNFTLSSKGKKSIYLLVISYKKEARTSQKIKVEILKYLETFLKDFNFIFYDNANNSINIFLDKDIDDFELKLDTLVDGFEKLAKSLEERYISIIEHPIIKIAKFDLAYIKVNLTSSEIIQLYEEIKIKLEKEKSKNIILIKDYTSHLPELLKTVQENLIIQNITINQLQKNQIELFVHKIYNLKNELFGFEILGRIKNYDTDEYIPASKFLKILESNNLTGEFDKAVINAVRKNIKYLKEIAENIFVNIYPTSLTYEPTVNELRRLIKECEKYNVNLFLELTEHTIISNKEIFEDLKGEKFAIAFDDFGVGYTNYEIVGELGERENAKVIKIDGSIVRNMTKSNVYTSMLESITLFANKIGMKTVYEFVENKEIMNKIEKLAKSLNIESEDILLQGYYLHKPTHFQEELKNLNKREVSNEI